MPVSSPISRIMSDAETEYSIQRATLMPRLRFASYQRWIPGAAMRR